MHDYTQVMKTRSTDQNLRRFGIELLIKWLIATEDKTTLTYREVKDRLKNSLISPQWGISAQIFYITHEASEKENHRGREKKFCIQGLVFFEISIQSFDTLATPSFIYLSTVFSAAYFPLSPSAIKLVKIWRIGSSG